MLQINDGIFMTETSLNPDAEVANGTMEHTEVTGQEHKVYPMLMEENRQR